MIGRQNSNQNTCATVSHPGWSIGYQISCSVVLVGGWRGVKSPWYIGVRGKELITEPTREHKRQKKFTLPSVLSPVRCVKLVYAIFQLLISQCVGDTKVIDCTIESSEWVSILRIIPDQIEPHITLSHVLYSASSFLWIQASTCLCLSALFHSLIEHVCDWYSIDEKPEFPKGLCILPKWHQHWFCCFVVFLLFSLSAAISFGLLTIQAYSESSFELSHGSYQTASYHWLQRKIWLMRTKIKQSLHSRDASGSALSADPSIVTLGAICVDVGAPSTLA